MEKIIQITAGRGPAECTWVVAQVLKKVLDEAQEQQLEAILLQREVGQENGTIETATIAIKGNNADMFANSWIGTIQWIGQSQFRKMRKRKNWFIGIRVPQLLADQQFDQLIDDDNRREIESSHF